MDGRDRVLVALDGGTPDRVPCALNFYHVSLDDTAPPGYDWEALIDVQFVRLAPSPEEESFSKAARPFPYDTRLGTFEQMATYARWSYRPETPFERNPLAKAGSLADLQAFPFPDADAPDPDETRKRAAALRDQVSALHARGLAAGGNLPHLGGELFEAAWRLRGLEAFLLDLLERPDWADFVLDRLTELACRNAEVLAHAGIDLLSLDDDVGAPVTMMISPELWQRFFKPRMATIIARARAIRPDLRFIFHSDGNFAPLIPDLLEIGIHGINPLQPEHMDAARIRAQYGARLALWGTVGRQTTFSFGTPEAIRQEVRLRIATLGRAGLILSPAYDLGEPDIPWVNVAAFLEAVRAYGR
jgi:uroporphyrinogen decarboxylase